MAEVKKKTSKIACKRSSGTPTDTLIELYSLAQSALLHEADRIWARFTVYLTLNSAVATPLVLSVKDMASNPSQYHFSTKMACAGIALAIIGLVLSWFWLRTTQSGKQWQVHCIRYICELEKKLTKANFWTKVYNAKSDEKHISIMRQAEKVNYCFLVIWSLVLILCAGRVVYAICKVPSNCILLRSLKS